MEFYKIGAEVVSKQVAITEVKVEERGETPARPLSIPQITRRIIQLESSGGKNNYSKCKAQGKFNRSGYGIHSGKYICFDSKEQEDKTIGEWFRKKLETMTLEEALKIYNSANPDYINNFLSLK